MKSLVEVNQDLKQGNQDPVLYQSSIILENGIWKISAEISEEAIQRLTANSSRAETLGHIMDDLTSLVKQAVIKP